MVSGSAINKDAASLQMKMTSLTEEVIRSYEELNLLYDLGESLSTAMNMEEITSLVLNMAWEVTGAGSGLLMLRDGDELFTKQNIGCDLDFQVRRNGDLPWGVIDRRTGIVVDDFSSGEFRMENLTGVKNALCTPIMTKERTLGVLLLMDKEDQPFTAMDLKLVNTISAQTALYMEGYLLHEMRMEERLKEQSQIHQEELEKIAEKFEFDDEMIEGFVADCMEPLADLEQQMLSLEKGAGGEVIDGLFRTMHTIKGTAKFFDFNNIANLAHAMEDVFGLLRDNKLTPSSAVIDALMDGLEGLNRILEEIREKKSDAGINLTGLVDRLKNVMDAKGPSLRLEETPEKEEGKDLGMVREKGRASDLAVRVPIEKLNNLTGHMQRLNNLAVGYMMEIKERMEEGQFGNEGGHEAGKLELLLAQVGKMYGDSQSQLMALRNIPIKKLFTRFPKLVRDLSRELGKRIDLEMSGEEVEIDRTIMDEIGGALVHMVRNAVDHGIELPEERAASGKREEGKIRVNGRKDGSEIVITIEDDGKGLDPDRVRKKALSMGIVTDREAGTMSDRKTLQLIFAPGFSTAEKVTDVSGRGVGMNVVKDVTARLGGKVDISSGTGAGTKFTMRIPSTVGISSVVLVNVNGTTFALPSAIVDEVTNIRDSDIYLVSKKEVVNYRDSVFPLIRLGEVLGGTSGSRESKGGKHPVLVVNLENGKRGLLADKVIGRTEVMVSPFRGVLKDSRFVSGATFLGNMLIPILDINGITGEMWNCGYEEGEGMISFSGDGYDLGAEREFITFELDGEPYGIGFGHLQEIIRHTQKPVKIPGVGRGLLGIINLRNVIIPLLDIKALGVRGDGNGGSNLKQRVLIVGGEENLLGLLVDGVKEVCRVGDGALEEVRGGGMLNSEYFPYMAKVGEEIIKIVDIDRIVDSYRRKNYG